jgi:enhancing lycopene biosynthesis protein 2
MKIGVILSGNGVFDGSEIQEAVFTLLAIDENNAEAVCMAPDTDQHHVLNHITGEEMNEKRNVLVESARIARGKISELSTVSYRDIDALVIPGGFGAAKNLTDWAFKGPDGEILPTVKKLINEMVLNHKPVCGLCMGPTVIAMALDGSGIKASLTVGTDKEPSPYDIKAVSSGMEKAGATVAMHTVREIEIDKENKIVTAPCYMMEASVKQIRDNVKMAVDATLAMI